MNPPKIQLPAAMETYRRQIEKSLKPYIRIHATPDAHLSLTQSKFGGLPYLPQGYEYPEGSSGQPLFLLAQINFAEVPELDGFPKKGLLQFYIGDDNMYGLDLDDPFDQSNYRIIYFDEVDEGDAQQDIELPDFDNIPVLRSHSLRFEKQWGPVAPQDQAFYEVFGTPAEDFFDRFGNDKVEVRRAYARAAQGRGHKLGGYAHFTQEDPRLVQEFEEAMLLLQIDSDLKNILWGDEGIGNFFIHPEDLKDREFSEVLYNWDSP
ncbi:MAG: YwqG family protein [Cyclobacteriaceae bacterium]